MTEREQFHRVVAGLSKIATGRLSLEASLTRVAEFAVNAVPGAEEAGLTVREPDRRDTVVATSLMIRQIDDLQHSLGQGPCISATTAAAPVLSGSLGGDRRWPRFGSRVARLGVHSALALPLVTADGVLGAIDLYARAKHAFDDRAAELGAEFAVFAAISVQNALVLAQTRRTAVRLQDALTARGIIDRAVGILMSRNGGTETDALARLRALSQHEHQKLTAVAQSIVDAAVRRARSLRAENVRRAEADLPAETDSGRLDGEQRLG